LARRSCFESGAQGGDLCLAQKPKIVQIDQVNEEIATQTRFW